MLVSYNWLTKFLNYKVDKKELSTILTAIGLEVESTSDFVKYKSNFSTCFVGIITACEKHPNADKLYLTCVNIGSQKLSIVCGATNVRVGLKVIVATVGTHLHTIDNKNIEIQKSIIRGQESDGMLCSESELGINKNKNGIWELGLKYQIGDTLDIYFANYFDTIYEIGLTPNRMDAMSHFGVARDVAAYLNYHKKLNLSVNLQIPELQNQSTTLPIRVEVENTNHCLKFAGIYIANINVKESPEWLKNYLQVIEINSINNIVDITNYILHAYGQPLHVYDADKIEKNILSICNIKEATPFITLDNNEIKLLHDDLMVCDGNKNPLCIAGVYGGLHSGVSATSKNIFLEAAVWDAVSIRKTSFKHKLRTQASMKYEKGIDASNNLNILKIATQMIIDLAAGQIKGAFIDEATVPTNERTLTTSFSFINKLSGANFSKEQVCKILEGLQFKITENKGNILKLIIPSHKLDITNANDVVEEIIRIDGINNIPISSRVLMSVNKNDTLFIKEKIPHLLVSLGFNEIFTNSLINSKNLKNPKAIKLLNSLNEELDVLTTSTLHNGLEAVAYNQNRQQSDLQFFEFNKTYTTEAMTYKETEILSLWLMGEKNPKLWNQEAHIFDLYDLKGYVNLILSSMHITNAEHKILEHEYLENGFSVWANNVLIANYGYVKLSVLNIFLIKQNVLFAEFFWNNLNTQSQPVNKYIPISRFPLISRDLSLVVDSALPYASIEIFIKKLNIIMLRNFRVFDLFESEKLGNNKKAIALNFEFGDTTKTLTDAEVDENMDTIINSLSKELNISIRK